MSPAEQDALEAVVSNCGMVETLRELAAVAWKAAAATRGTAAKMASNSASWIELAAAQIADVDGQKTTLDKIADIKRTTEKQTEEYRAKIRAVLEGELAAPPPSRFKQR